MPRGKLNPYHRYQVLFELPPDADEFDFGPWEQIFYGEFDGRRAKRVLVKIIGE